jgi:maleylpyruvate isomerase
VRIVLSLKGVDYEYVPVHLLKDGGEQHSDAFRGKNPQQQVPVLEVEEGDRTVRLAQSVAIVEYLEETFSKPCLLAGSARDRAHVRRLVEMINSGIQPLQNLGVLKRVKALGGDPQEWGRQAIAAGFEALEAAMAPRAGRFAVGDAVSLADVYLVPQMYNARRFSVALEPYPTLVRVDQACSELEAFKLAHPDAQPDAELG